MSVCVLARASTRVIDLLTLFVRGGGTRIFLCVAACVTHCSAGQQLLQQECTMGPSHDKQHRPNLLSPPVFLVFRLSPVFLVFRLSRFHRGPSVPTFPCVQSVPTFPCMLPSPDALMKRRPLVFITSDLPPLFFIYCWPPKTYLCTISLFSLAFDPVDTPKMTQPEVRAGQNITGNYLNEVFVFVILKR